MQAPRARELATAAADRQRWRSTLHALWPAAHAGVHQGRSASSAGHWI